MTKTVISMLAMVFMPVATFAFINATSVTFDGPVAPGAQADAEVHTQLTNGDDWHSTRIEVSIPGPNNDYSQCFNTADADSNGTHVRHVLFPAPNAEGSYPVTATAYEGGSCTGSHNDAYGTLVVAIPVPEEPEPTDICPNIEGDQEVVPEGKEIVEGQCVDIVETPEEPEEPEAPSGGGDETVSAPSSMGGGGCGSALCRYNNLFYTPGVAPYQNLSPLETLHVELIMKLYDMWLLSR